LGAPEVVHRCLVIIHRLILLFSDGFRFLSTALHIRISPSFSPWGVTLHLWLAFGSYGVPFFSLCSWWRKDVSHDVVWDVFVANCKICKISCFTKTQLCFYAPCLAIFTSSSQHCVISWRCPHIGICCHRQPHLSWFGFGGCYFCKIVTIVMVEAKNNLYHDQFPMDMFIPLVVNVFKCLHQ